MTDTQTVKKPVRRRRSKRDKTEIIDVAANMFREKGYDRTTLDDIAQALGVTKPALYYHFPSKEDILLESIRTGYIGFEAEIVRRDNLKASGRERVEIYLRLYLELITSTAGVTMIVADERVLSPEGNAQYQKIRRLMTKDLEDRIAQGVADGTIRASETRLTTFAIFGMFNAIVPWFFRRPDITIDILLDRYLSILFDGIGCPPA